MSNPSTHQPQGLTHDQAVREIMAYCDQSGSFDFQLLSLFGAGYMACINGEDEDPKTDPLGIVWGLEARHKTDPIVATIDLALKLRKIAPAAK